MNISTYLVKAISLFQEKEGEKEEVYIERETQLAGYT